MRKKILDVLHEYWGYPSFREKQEEIILSVLNGMDTLGLLPTGGGKSLTFQVPAMLLDGITIVITPLISLMKDQVDNLRTRGIKATYIHSGLKYREIQNAIEKCIYGRYKLLYISPERLSSRSFMDALRRMPVSLIAVDEAHCISQWGYDFRPSYLQISKIRQLFPDIPVLALTATATPAVASDIMSKLEFRMHAVWQTSFCRTNLSYIVRQTEKKENKLIAVLSKSTGSGIVYVRSRIKAKQIAEELVAQGFSADYYHAGLSNEEKQDKQDKWKKNERRIMVATNAFGMGIDKPDVRLVVHLDIPNSLEEYYQEAGRAGRDMKKSYAVLLVASGDKVRLRKRVSDAYPSKDFISQVYERVCNFLDIGLGGGFDKLLEFNFSLFCTTFKYPQAPVYSALKILTHAGYIEFVDEVETQSRVIMLVEKGSLYDIPETTPLMETVLEIILRNYTGLFADYVFIDEASMAYKYGMSPQDIYEALIGLTKLHVLHYIPRRRTPYIYFPSSRVEPRHLQIPKSVYEDGKKRMEDRINAMLGYAFGNSECREKMMLAYFGEKSSDCGRCDICVESGQNEKDNIREIQNGILYMLSLKPCSFADFLGTLSFKEHDILEMLRFLSDENYIFFDGNKFHLKK